jgi:hypothetical protein
MDKEEDFPKNVQSASGTMEDPVVPAGPELEIPGAKEV